MKVRTAPGGQFSSGVDRAKTRGAKAGYVYLHSAVDGFSRLAYTEPLANQTAKTAIGFFARARAFFQAHGIGRITRVITDNGSCYRAAAFTRSLFDAARHQRIKPFTPKHNGKVERYQRILAEELLYARTWTSRSPASRSDQDLGGALQLPPTAHRRREPTTGLTPPRRRHQRHDEQHLVSPATARKYAEISKLSR